METNQDVKVLFKDYGEIVIPKGTKLTNMTATGKDENYHFVDEFQWMKKKYASISNILIHDAKHYGINIPKEFVKYD